MSSSIEITPELMAGFLDEAPEYLEMLDSGLMELEGQASSGVLSLTKPEDLEQMTTMFRAAHSLKGLAAAFGFNKIKDLTHLMETLFDEVRMGKRDLTSESFETLFRVFDRLKELVAELSDESAEPVEIEDILKALQGILQASPGDGKSTPDRVNDTDHDATRVADEQPTATIAEEPTKALELFEDAELTTIFIETTEESIDDLNQKLLGLEENENDEELLNAAFRCAHNIKGASGAAGLIGMNRITHDLETVFDHLRNRRLALDVDLMNAIFRVVDKLRSVIEDMKSGTPADVPEGELADVFKPWSSTSQSQPAASNSTTSDKSKSDDRTYPSEGAAHSSDTTLETQSTDLSFEGDWITVELTFEPDDDEATIQAYLIHNKLCDIATVHSSSPDIDELDGSSPLTSITFRVESDIPVEDIERLLSAFPVKSLEVKGLGETSPAAKLANEVSQTKAPAPAGTRASPVDRGSATPTPAQSAQSPTPTTVPAEVDTPAGAAASTQATKRPPKKAAITRTGETLRVDQERLDELMNLGGELVINRARFRLVHNKFREVFEGRKVGFLIDDIDQRLEKIGSCVESMLETGGDTRGLDEMSGHVRHLSVSFHPVRLMMRKVHDLRAFMFDFDEALHGLTQVSDGIQRGIMSTRMVPVGPTFNRFRRVIRDLAKSNGKKINLVLKGEHTELDKRMIDELGDPLTHMVRNSGDHGIESPEERVRAGKDPVGTLTLSAYHRGNSICIEVADDGAGINLKRVKAKILERELATPAQVESFSDRELQQFIFKPGFSTAQTVTDVSGRGMGMDIVVTKIEELSGTIEVDSTEGVGTRIVIKLPLTLAILTSMVTRIGKGIYAIPLESVAEIITLRKEDIQFIQRRQVICVRDHVIPLTWFENLFETDLAGLQTETRDRDEIKLVIIGIDDEKIGLVVDELLGQEDVVIKSIAENYQNVRGFAGASIRGDGSVSLILDVGAVMEMAARKAMDPLVTAPSRNETVESLA